MFSSDESPLSKWKVGIRFVVGASWILFVMYSIVQYS